MKPVFSLRFWPRRREPELEEFAELENYLQEVLVPVSPRLSFVSGLKERLLEAPVPRLSSMPKGLQYTLLGALGVASGLLIIVTGIRATVTLLAALGLLSQMKKSSNPVLELRS
jgi:hypothetical protein